MSRARLLLLTCCLALLSGCASAPAPEERAEPAAQSSGASGACAQGRDGEAHASCGSPGDECCAQEGPSAASASEPQPEPARSAGASEEERSAGPAYVTRGPSSLDPAACGVGERVADARFTPLGGETTSLRAWAGQAPASVVLFTSLGCPVTKSYAPRLERLSEAWRAKGVQVLALDPSAVEEAPEILAWAEQQGWTFPVARDPDYALCDALDARRTADAFLLDREGVLRYRGPVDDQFGINYRLEAPRVHHLERAIAHLLAGQPILDSALEAPGCKITRLKLD